MFYGVDGCRSGWCLARLGSDGTCELEVLPAFADVARRVSEGAAKHRSPEPQTLVLVDMPIGLPDGTKVRRRACDSLARQALVGHGSRVFPVPVRPAAEAPTYEEANDIQRRLTDKGLSRQSWALVPKILEVDTVVRRPEMAVRFYESHPEICFARLSGGQPVGWPKRDTAGVMARAHLLEPYLPDLWALLHRHLSALAAAAIDDVLDSLALAVHARLSAEHGLLCLPPEPEVDDRGLPMRIVTAAVGGSWR